MSDQDAQSPKTIADYVKISVSKDRLLAFADFSDPPLLEEENHFSGTDLLQLMEKEGIHQDLITIENADHLLENWHGKMIKLVVAKGVPPTPPVDETLELKFNPNAKAMPQVMEDGSVDYRELGYLQMTSANEPLAIKKPGVSGKPGIDVYGNEIPSKPPKTVAMPSGKNTSVSPDGLMLIATISGQVVFEDHRRISVAPVYHVKENVDFSTGNINFNGSVVVHGNVNAGFRVAAEGNIEIMGFVEAADIEAVGDIVVRGGIQGTATTRINAGHDLKALYLQNAVVNASGDVIVSDSIMNSVIVAKEVRVSGKRGLLVGGMIRVKTKLFARIIGSRMGTKTRIVLGYRKELDDRIQAMEVEMEQMRQSIAKINEFLNQIKHLEALHKRLSEEQIENVERMTVTLEVEQDKLKELETNYEQTLKERNHLEAPMVEIGTLAFPGVIISTGTETMELEEVLRTGKIIHDKTGLRQNN